MERQRTTAGISSGGSVILRSIGDLTLQAQEACSPGWRVEDNVTSLANYLSAQLEVDADTSMSAASEDELADLLLKALQRSCAATDV